MGIKGLMKLLQEEAPACIKEIPQMSQLAGRSVALDASMAIYQFLIAIRSSDGGGPSQVLTNEAGEVTSHLQGMFSRTIRMMESGVKPVYVFDGKPPTMKGGELAKRSDRRAEAQKGLDEATESGNTEDIERFNKRLVRATKQHSEDCKELLRLMGVPVLTAPCEAEATCAELAKSGKVFATGTEDMDALTFGSPVLYRRLTFAAAKKVPVLEVKLERALEDLGLTREQFVDLCILCGCDYCDTIRGVGPKKAFAGIKEHKSIENFIEALQKSNSKGVTIPDEWLGENPIYKQAREMFVTPEVVDIKEVEIKWKDPMEVELIEFLVNKHGFQETRVQSAIERLKKSKGTQSQKRLDSFFTVLPSTGTKRKVDTKTAAAGKKGAPAKKAASASAMKRGKK
uniref:Flap endonuclease 1 n=1 Tax=Globisporangium ultimum (strain ATCC 200006 / CBS 805.95 / DAOM BR144) TaxID=431595 RepID=K3WPV9_GLOUD